MLYDYYAQYPINAKKELIEKHPACNLYQINFSSKIEILLYDENNTVYDYLSQRSIK